MPRKPEQPKTLKEALGGRTARWLHRELDKRYEVSYNSVARWVRLPRVRPDRFYWAGIKRLTGFDYATRGQDAKLGVDVFTEGGSDE